MSDTTIYSLIVVAASIIACHNDKYLRTGLIVGTYYLIEIGLSFITDQFWSADNMIPIFGIYICTHVAAINILVAQGSQSKILQSTILSLFILLFVLSSIDYFYDGGILESDPIVTIYSTAWRALMIAHATSLLAGSYYVGLVNLANSWFRSLVGGKKNPSIYNQRKRQ